MENLGDRISITTFIDPHNFCYIRYIDNVEQRNVVENQIEELIKSKKLQRCKSVAPLYCGALKYLKLKRYIRIEVLQVYNTFSKDGVDCLVWAMDYGYPIRTAVHYIWDLPEELCDSLDLVRWAGVANVLPASIDYDFLSQEKHLVEEKQWHQRLCERLKVSLTSATAVFFNEKYNMEGHRWGELTIMNTLGTFSIISKCLVDSNEALLDMKTFRSKMNECTNLYEIILKSATKFEVNDISVTSQCGMDDLSLIKETHWDRRSRNSRSESDDSDHDSKRISERILKEKNENAKESNNEPKRFNYSKDFSEDAYFALNGGLPFETNYGCDDMSNDSEVSLKSYARSFLEKKRLESIRLNKEKAKSKPQLESNNESLLTSSGNPNSKPRYVSKPEESCELNRDFEAILLRQKSKQREQIEAIRQSYFLAQKENNGFKRIYSENIKHIPAGLPPERDFFMNSGYKLDSDFMSCMQDFTAIEVFNSSKHKEELNHNKTHQDAKANNISKERMPERGASSNKKSSKSVNKKLNKSDVQQSKSTASDSHSELDEFFICKNKATEKEERPEQQINESYYKSRVVAQPSKTKLSKSDIEQSNSTISESHSEYDELLLRKDKGIAKEEYQKQEKKEIKSQSRAGAQPLKTKMSKSYIEQTNSTISDSHSEYDELLLRKDKGIAKEKYQKQEKIQIKSQSRAGAQPSKTKLNKNDVEQSNWIASDSHSELDEFFLRKNKATEKEVKQEQKINESNSKSRVVAEPSITKLNNTDIEKSNSTVSDSHSELDSFFLISKENQKQEKKEIKSKNSDIGEAFPIQTELPNFYLNIFDTTNVSIESQEPHATSLDNEDEKEIQLDNEQYIHLLNELESTFAETSNLKIPTECGEENQVKRKSNEGNEKSIDMIEKGQDKANDGLMNVKEYLNLLNDLEIESVELAKFNTGPTKNGSKLKKVASTTTSVNERNESLDVDLETASCHSSSSKTKVKSNQAAQPKDESNDTVMAEELANLLNALDISTCKSLSPTESTNAEEPSSSTTSKLRDISKDGFNAQEYVNLLNDLENSIRAESPTILEADDCFKVNEYVNCLNELFTDCTNKEDDKSKVRPDVIANECLTKARDSKLNESSHSISTKSSESSNEKLLNPKNVSKSFICNDNKRSPNDDVRSLKNQAKLLEIQKVEEIRTCKSEMEFSACSMVENWVMAHSKTPLFPLRSYNETVFHKEIQIVLNSLKFSRTFRIQSYAWPHLQRNNSLVLINPRDSGKTWSYLPVICSLVAFRLYNTKNHIPHTYGPLAIIMVASSFKAESLYSECRNLMQAWDSEDIKPVVGLYGRHHENEVKLHLLNSCGILITTPALMLKIFKINESQYLIDKKRLHHLVVDDIDLMLERNKEQTENCLKAFTNMLMKNQTKLPIQLVMTATAWSSWYIPFIKITSDVMLLIGDFLEAAVYSKSSISISLGQQKEKFNMILKYLRNLPKHKVEEHHDELRKRTIIFCNNDEEVIEVKRLLNISGYTTVVGTNEGTQNEKYLIEMWKEKDSAEILICTDEAFPRLQIQNAAHIIHYSLAKSWTRFTFRFYAANEIFTNFIKSNFENVNENDQQQERLSSLILLDDENSLQLPRLIAFMRKHSQVIHPDLEKVVQSIIYERELLKVERQKFLCEEYLEFGDCSKRQCIFRHNITASDRLPKNSDIPYSGDLHIAIIKLVSPVHFIARLLEHRASLSKQWQPVMRSKDFNSFFISLNLFYSDPNNGTLYWPPKIGELCIYQQNHYYRRCKITDIQRKSKSFNIIDDNLLVNIYLIDVGESIVSVKANQLLQIKDQFKSYPAQAVHIRLLNVIPFDGERTWDLETIETVASWLKVDASTTIRVNIKLAIQNNIWVNDVCVEEFLKTLNSYVRKINLKKSLINENYAVQDTKESVILQKANDLQCFNYENFDENEASLVKTQNNANAYNLHNSKDLKASTPTPTPTSTINDKATSVLNSSENEEENWDASPDNSAEECFVPLQKTYDEYLVMKNKKPSNTNESLNHQQKETWSKLPLFKLSQIKVNRSEVNGQWSSFYFQLNDEEHRNSFENLKKIINDHINTLKTDETEVNINSLKSNENYLVKYDDMYVRAKLLSIQRCNESNQYIFFLCDLAFIKTFSEQDLISIKYLLYESSRHIIEFTPYQSAHCALAGIETDFCCRPISIFEPFLYIYPVLDNGMKKLNDQLSVNSFKVLFYSTFYEDDFGSVKMINKKLIDREICKIDPETKHFLSYNLFINSDLLENFDVCLKEDFEIQNHQPSKDDIKPSNEPATSVDRNIDELIDNVAKDLAGNINVEEKKEGFLTKALGGFKHYAVSELIKLISPAKKPEEKAKANTKIEETCSDTNEIHQPTIRLKASFKIPVVTWYETDFLIYILIHVPDMVKYYLHLSKDTITFSTIVNDEKYGLILNLLGNIDPSMSSYEIRGLNLAIRATKTVYMSWPRLIKQTDKFNWIKYNIDAISNNEQAETYPLWLLSKLRSCEYNFEGYWDESEDEESVKLETFNRIQRTDHLSDDSD